MIGNIARIRSYHASTQSHAFLGGAALHVALAASRAGLSSAPVSVVGTDLKWIAADLNLSAIDLSSVRVVEGPSCAFWLSYDQNYDLAELRASYGVATLLTDHALASINEHAVYHICCRQPLDVSRVLSELLSRSAIFSVDFFISSARDLVPSITSLLSRASVVFVNAAEFRALSAAIDVNTIRAVVVTDGPREARLIRHGIQVVGAVPPSARPVEVTGAGDTLAGTFLAAALTGAGDQEALERAVVAASEHISAVHLPLDTSYDKG